MSSGRVAMLITCKSLPVAVKCDAGCAVQKHQFSRGVVIAVFDPLEHTAFRALAKSWFHRLYSGLAANACSIFVKSQDSDHFGVVYGGVVILGFFITGDFTDVVDLLDLPPIPPKPQVFLAPVVPTLDIKEVVRDIFMEKVDILFPQCYLGSSCGISQVNILFTLATIYLAWCCDS